MRCRGHLAAPACSDSASSGHQVDPENFDTMAGVTPEIARSITAVLYAAERQSARQPGLVGAATRMLPVHWKRHLRRERRRAPPRVRPSPSPLSPTGLAVAATVTSSSTVSRRPRLRSAHPSWALASRAVNPMPGGASFGFTPTGTPFSRINAQQRARYTCPESA